MTNSEAKKKAIDYLSTLTTNFEKNGNDKEYIIITEIIQKLALELDIDIIKDAFISGYDEGYIDGKNDDYKDVDRYESWVEYRVTADEDANANVEYCNSEWGDEK